MIYISIFTLVFYYVINGLGAAFFMNKLAKAGIIFWILVVLAWPFFLPLGAFICAMEDRRMRRIKR